jgi:hypothetical protein
MSDRQTKEFTTPSNHKVVLRTYLTGREVTEVKAIMFSKVEMTMEDMASKKMNMGGLSGTLIAEQERRVFDFLIVSVDGDTENPVEKFLDLPSVDYDAVTAEIEHIKNPTTPEK